MLFRSLNAFADAAHGRRFGLGVELARLLLLGFKDALPTLGQLALQFRNAGRVRGRRQRGFKRSALVAERVQFGRVVARLGRGITHTLLTLSHMRRITTP